MYLGILLICFGKIPRSLSRSSTQSCSFRQASKCFWAKRKPFSCFVGDRGASDIHGSFFFSFFSPSKLVMEPFSQAFFNIYLNFLFCLCRIENIVAECCHSFSIPEMTSTLVHNFVFLCLSIFILTFSFHCRWFCRSEKWDRVSSSQISYANETIYQVSDLVCLLVRVNLNWRPCPSKWILA